MQSAYMGSARRGSGEGAVYRRERTRRTKAGEVRTTVLWCATVEAGRDPLTGKRRRVEVAAKTKAAALKKVEEARRAADAGLVVDRTLTLGPFLARWLETVVANRVDSANTVENYRAVLQRHVIPALGTIPVVKLTPEAVDGFLAGKAAAGLSRSYVGRMRTVLADALTHAERRGIVTRNAGRLSVMPKCQPTIQRRSFTVSEARAVLDAATGERLHALVVAGMTLGLRPGELTGLLWEDLDVDATPPTLRITGSMKRRPDSSLYRGSVKRSRAGERTIAIPPVLVAALVEHRRRQAAERLAIGELWQDHGLIFPSEMGTPLDPSNVRKVFTRVAHRAGITGAIPYMLRHSAASLLLDSGASIEEVADLLGDDPQTLYRHYRHRVRPVVDTATVRMEGLFGTTG